MGEDVNRSKSGRGPGQRPGQHAVPVPGAVVKTSSKASKTDSGRGSQRGAPNLKLTSPIIKAAVSNGTLALKSGTLASNVSAQKGDRRGGGTVKQLQAQNVKQQARIQSARVNPEGEKRDKALLPVTRSLVGQTEQLPRQAQIQQQPTVTAHSRTLLPVSTAQQTSLRSKATPPTDQSASSQSTQPPQTWSNVNDALRDVQQARNEYATKAGGKNVLQQWGDNVREGIWGDRDDQFKNLRQTEEQLVALQGRARQGEDVGAELRQLQGSYRSETRRVTEAQAFNTQVGEVAYTVGKGVAVTAAAAAVVGTGGAAGLVLAGVAAVATSSAIDGATVLGAKLTGDEGTSEFGPKLSVDNSIGGVGMQAASGEQVSSEQIQSAAWGTVTDFVTGAFNAKGIASARKVQQSMQGASKLELGLAVGKSHAVNTLQQTGVQEVVSAGQILTGSGSADDKQRALGEHLQNTGKHLLSNVLSSGLSAGLGSQIQVSSKALDVGANLALDTATNYGQMSVDNAIDGDGFGLSKLDLIEGALNSGSGAITNMASRPQPSVESPSEHATRTGTEAVDRPTSGRPSVVDEVMEIYRSGDAAPASLMSDAEGNYAFASMLPEGKNDPSSASSERLQDLGSGEDDPTPNAPPSALQILENRFPGIPWQRLDEKTHEAIVRWTENSAVFCKSADEFDQEHGPLMSELIHDELLSRPVYLDLNRIDSAAKALASSSVSDLRRLMASVEEPPAPITVSTATQEDAPEALPDPRNQFDAAMRLKKKLGDYVVNEFSDPRNARAEDFLLLSQIRSLSAEEFERTVLNAPASFRKDMLTPLLEEFARRGYLFRGDMRSPEELVAAGGFLLMSPEVV